MTTITSMKNQQGASKMTSRPKRLKKYILDAGYSIYSLAERLGVNYSTVSYWQNGKKFPRHDKLVKLEDMFGVGYRELFSDLSDEEIRELEERKQVHDRKDIEK